MPLVDNLRQRYGNVKFGEYKYAFPIPDAEISANSNVKTKLWIQIILKVL